MKYSYFIPTIHFGPIKGTTISQRLPLELIEGLIIGDSAEFEINREIFSNGEGILKEKKLLKYSKSKWANLEAENFIWTNLNNDNLCYLETTMNVTDGAVMHHHIPGYYVFYTNKLSKSYLSCGSYKYGNPRVILQVAEFGQWLDGYPCINIDKDIDTTYSIIIINPYNRVTNIEIEIPELNISLKIKVKPKRTERVDFSEIIDRNEWSGQVYVYGSQRAVIYFVNHKISSFANITTIEHPDPFRAEKTKLPRLQKLRSSFHTFLKSKRDDN